MTEQEKMFVKGSLEDCKAEAEEMGVSLQEYLLLLILEELRQR